MTQRRSCEKPFAFSESVISNVGSGASDVFARTLLVGISRSRPVRRTEWKTLKVSSQFSMWENGMYQFTTLRYLPNSVLRLTSLSRFSKIFVEQGLLSSTFGPAVTILSSETRKGGNKRGSS